MSTNYRLRKLLLCTVLEIGALMGVPMRPEEIDRLMRTSGQITVSTDCDGSDGLIPNSDAVSTRCPVQPEDASR